MLATFPVTKITSVLLSMHYMVDSTSASPVDISGPTSNMMVRWTRCHQPGIDNLNEKHRTLYQYGHQHNGNSEYHY